MFHICIYTYITAVRDTNTYEIPLVKPARIFFRKSTVNLRPFRPPVHFLNGIYAYNNCGNIGKIYLFLQIMIAAS